MRGSPVRLREAAARDSLERALREVDGAISLVLVGAATRVKLSSIPRAERAAPIAAEWARQAGVGFRVERDKGPAVTLVLGPISRGA